MYREQTDRKEYLFLVIVLAVSSLLLFTNMGNRYLWQDEAETALVSKTILTNGVPRGYDGKNFFSQEGEFTYGRDYLWVLDPWLPFYLVAGFFKIFGVSTFVSRLPFVLFGIGTIALTYFFAKSVTRDVKTAAVATVLLMLSVPFLLLCRQCRYYVLVAFFSLLGLYGYLMILEKKRTGTVIFLISGILLFHCNHLFSAVLLATAFVHALLCQRQQFVRVFILCAVVTLVSLPWLIWVSEMRYARLFDSHLLAGRGLLVLAAYIRFIHLFIFPLFLLLVPVCQSLLWGRQTSIRKAVLENTLFWKNLLLLFLFIAVTLAGLLVLSPRPFFRYITQLIPVFCVITAVIVISAIRPYFKTAIAIIAFLLAAVFFVDYRYGSSRPADENMVYVNFFDYVREITSDYDGPIEGMVKYLRENGSDEDVVAITYGDLPLKFYTNMRVIGGLTGEDISPGLRADWVIIRKNHACRGDFKVKQYFLQNIPFDKYRRIVIDYPDNLWGSGPYPERHRFATAEKEDRVVIYRKQ